jgi:Predicted prefoldin, molecular chaperone implicated in de novo protein folding
MRLRRCRQPLALAITIALALPGAALAQTAKERELEARIAQLEAQVQALLQAQQQTRETVEETRSRLDAVQVASAPADDGKPRIQSTPILPAGNPGASFSYGGFIKLDAMATDTSDGVIAEGSAGRLFYVPSTIPVVADGAEPDADPYTDIHAAFSRFWLAADWTSDGGDKFRAYIEADMYGGGSANLGNEVSTNTHGITVRHAYVTWNRWLAGQTWTNFQDVAALPDTVDFIGVTDGTIFVRQAQVRYTNGPFSVSLENPHTTVSDVATAARNNAGGSDLFPDLTARYVFKGDWGHFSVAGLLRQLKSGDETDTGFAVSLSGRFNIGANDDIRWMASYGSVRAVRQRPWPPRLGTGQLRRGREHPLRPRQPDLLAVPEAGRRRRGQLGRTRARG